MEQVLDMVGRKGLVRPRDLAAANLPTVLLTRLHRRGAIERMGRGLYRLPGGEMDEHFSKAQVAVRAPAGVLCLLSALSFYGIGTQLPGQVWLAIRRGTSAPKMENPTLRVVRMSGKAFAEEVETHKVAGATLRVYSPAKTVADCFKFRNKVGLDVALEALREALRYRKCTIAEIDRCAAICRVQKVMRPYLEAQVDA